MALKIDPLTAMTLLVTDQGSLAQEPELSAVGSQRPAIS
jgi:hypothetical protein